MNTASFNQIVDLLTRHMSESRRDSLITPAFSSYLAIYDNIDWSGAARPFTVRLIQQLEQYGEIEPGHFAVEHLLKAISPQLGLQDQHAIDTLLTKLSQPESQQSSSSYQETSTPQRLSDAETSVANILSDDPTDKSSRNSYYHLAELFLSLVVSIWASYLMNWLDLAAPWGLILLSIFAILLFLVIHRMHFGKKLWRTLRGYPHWRIWLGTAFTLAILLSAYPLWPRTQPPQEYLVLISDFLPENSDEAQRMTARVTQELRRVVEQTDTPNFRVQSISAIRSPQEAINAAREANALLVVWGEVIHEENETLVSFTLTDLLSGSSNATRPARLQPIGYLGIGGDLPCEVDCMSIKGPVAQRITAVAHAAKGLLYYSVEDFISAERQFRKALADDESEIDVEYLCDPTTVNTSVSYAQNASDEWRPDLIRYYLGRSLAARGDYQAALLQLHQVVASNPQDSAVWIAMGIACDRWLGTNRQATLFWEQAIQLASSTQDQAASFFNQGIVYGLQGEWILAKDAYDTAYNLVVAQQNAENITLYAILVERAGAEIKLEEYSIARETLLQASELDEDALWAYLELAYLDGVHLQNRRKARNWLAEAAKTAQGQYPLGMMDIQRMWGELCWSWNDFECAEAAYEKALEYVHSSGWLYSRVGDFYRHHEEWEKAHQHYRQAASLRPNDPTAHERLAYTYYQLGEYESSAGKYKQAIDLAYPNDHSTIDTYCNALILVQERGNLPESAIYMSDCDHLDISHSHTREKKAISSRTSRSKISHY